MASLYQSSLSAWSKSDKLLDKLAAILKGILMKNLILLTMFLLIFSCGSAKEPKPDKHGKLPSDYAAIYYKATNEDDYETVKKLMSDKYYLSFAQLFNNPPSFDRFKKKFSRHMRKHNGYEFDPSSKRSGYHSVNAEGVYSFGAKVRMKPDKRNPKPYVLNDELCFKLINAEWKVVNKLKGE